MNTITKPRDPRLALQIGAAFLAVYIIWGSTYFAIKVAIQTMPPLLMAGARFLVAGALVFGWLLLRGVARPKLVHWRSALILGGLLLFAGNGGVTWAEQVIPSGLAALIVAMVPIYVALLDWIRPGGARPTVLRIVGLVIGFVGVALLIGPLATGGFSPALLAACVPLIGSLCWAAGTLYARSAKLPANPLVGTGMEMLVGGVLLTGVGLLLGEGGQIHPEKFSLDSLLAFGFLVIFGSIVAFTSYIWLLGQGQSRTCLDLRLRQSGGRGLPWLGLRQRGSDRADAHRGGGDSAGGDDYHALAEPVSRSRASRVEAGN